MTKHSNTIFCIQKQSSGLILTACDTFEAERVCGGPGGYKIKEFKTRKGAERWIAERNFKPGEVMVQVWLTSVTTV